MRGFTVENFDEVINFKDFGKLEYNHILPLKKT